MRIATNAMYDRASAAMGALDRRSTTLFEQLSSNKRLAAPSSDAAAYRQLTGLRRAGSDEVQDKANVAFASAQLQATDQSLAEIEQQLQRVNELAMRAGSGSLAPTERALIATELDTIVEDLLRMANATDARGKPLFSGASDATPYVRQTDGSVLFTGDGEAGAIPIGDGASIVAATSGENVFGNLPAAAGGTTDIFAMASGLAQRLRDGDGIGDALTDVTTALNTVATARSSVGARGARLELESERLAQSAVDREVLRSGLEDTDVAATVTELQKTLTVLQATQASFTKLTQLSLFDYLR